MAIEPCELHVIMCATHGFRRSVVDSVIQRNLNPLAHLEASAMLLAGVVHGFDAEEVEAGACRR